MRSTLLCFSCAGGLIILQPNKSAPLHFAATAAFLSKIYGDYLNIINIPGASCGSEFFSRERLQNFARSQVGLHSILNFGHTPKRIDKEAQFQLACKPQIID